MSGVLKRSLSEAPIRFGPCFHQRVFPRAWRMFSIVSAGGCTLVLQLVHLQYT